MKIFDMELTHEQRWKMNRIHNYLFQTEIYFFKNSFTGYILDQIFYYEYLMPGSMSGSDTNSSETLK